MILEWEQRIRPAHRLQMLATLSGQIVFSFSFARSEDLSINVAHNDQPLEL